MNRENTITDRAVGPAKSGTSDITAIDFTLYPQRNSLEQALVEAHAAEHKKPRKNEKSGDTDHHSTVPSENKSGYDQRHDHDHNHDNNHDHGKMSMNSAFGGPYKSMNALGSGTSLNPASTPAYMLHFKSGDWSLMAHGEIKAGINSQTGPRGVTRGESLNWGMLMAERKLGPGSLMLRGMVSLEPFTMPGGGSPMLFQTGETYKGREIVDAQHPHNLVMELAAGYTLPVSKDLSVFVYGGPVAEPALGPTAFMHRESAMGVPLSHHWQDATHISTGVVTLGADIGKFRLEGSRFHGKEPGEDRLSLNVGNLDSWSTRLSFAPTPDLVMQVSHGHLKNPEAHEPGDVDRTTASFTYNKRWTDGNWATTGVFGRNHTGHGGSNSYLLETNVNFLDKNYIWGRFESASKHGLERENIFGKPGGQGDDHHDLPESARINAFTIGAGRDIWTTNNFRLGLGGEVTFYDAPDHLNSIYGETPVGLKFFLRVRPDKM